MEDVVRRKVRKELEGSRPSGPHSSLTLPNLCISSLGVVPQKTSRDFRLIDHLSYPKWSSVNGAIDPKLSCAKYASLDSAIAKLGRGALFAKYDIKSTFCLLPVHPRDFKLLGFTFEGAFYYNKDCSISCSASECFSTILEWYLHAWAGLGNVMHELDDFIWGEGEAQGSVSPLCPTSWSWPMS